MWRSRLRKVAKGMVWFHFNHLFGSKSIAPFDGRFASLFKPSTIPPGTLWLLNPLKIKARSSLIVCTSPSKKGSAVEIGIHRLKFTPHRLGWAATEHTSGDTSGGGHPLPDSQPTFRSGRRGREFPRHPCHPYRFHRIRLDRIRCRVEHLPKLNFQNLLPIKKPPKRGLF